MIQTSIPTVWKLQSAGKHPSADCDIQSSIPAFFLSVMFLRIMLGLLTGAIYIKIYYCIFILSISFKWSPLSAICLSSWGDVLCLFFYSRNIKRENGSSFKFNYKKERFEEFQKWGLMDRYFLNALCYLGYHEPGLEV